MKNEVMVDINDEKWKFTKEGFGKTIGDAMAEIGEALLNGTIAELGTDVGPKPEPEVRTVKYERQVSSCNGCPLRGIDGGPSPAMVCDHADAPNCGYIITRAEVSGFPEQCPLPKTSQEPKGDTHD